MTSYRTLSHTFLTFCFSSEIVISWSVANFAWCPYWIIEHTHTFHRFTIRDDRYPGICCEFSRRSIKNDRFLYNLLCIFNFGHSKLHLSSITLHVTAALNSPFLFVVGAKPFLANQNVSYDCFLCALQIFHIFVVSVSCVLLDTLQ